MIFRNKSPVSAVSGIMTVISHHKVIIHLEGIIIGLFTVNINNIIFYLQKVLLICFDDSFIQRQRMHSQLNRLPLFRNIKRSEIILCPWIVAIEWKYGCI